jgi:hypothetical protein
MAAMSPGKKALLALGVLAALTGLQIWRLGAPGVAPADAPPETFSATRAIAALRAVMLDEPHPIATPENAVVRDRVIAAMKAMDYEVEVQRTFACSQFAACAEVANVVARVPGQPRDRPAVAVVAHYDSVPAGPGASDDGTGVATLIEVARVLRHERFANPIVFVIDDGEEAGLLGAYGLVADPAHAKDLAFVINVEARGTSGTPFLFETSHNNGWLIPIVARELPRPVTTSLFATIYEQLPNDTDLSVFKRAGHAGINFAYIGDATQYHTPLDNFANVDTGSMQQRGDQVLAMARAFGAADLTTRPGDAVWFDVLALFVVWWPAAWNLGIAALALAVLAAAIVLAVRRNTATVGGVVLGVASFVGTAALALGLGVAIAWLLGLRAPGALFVPYAGFKIAAAWCAGLAAAVVVVAVARRRASFDAIVLGHAVAWIALGTLLALRLPGAAYVAIVPGSVLAVLALLRQLARTGEQIPSVGALVAAAPIYLPFGLVVHDSLGGGSLGVIATLLALVGTTFAPMITASARRVVPALLAATLVLTGIALLVPTTSPTHPRHLSLAYLIDSDAGTAHWQTDALPPMLRTMARFAPTPASMEPWYAVPRRAHTAPALMLTLAPPDVAVAAPAASGAAAGTTPGDETRTATLEISSPRAAPRLTITWHSDAPLVSVRVNGVTLSEGATRLRGARSPGWHRVVVRGSSARLEIATRGAAPVEAFVSDTSHALPAIGAALRFARDAWGAVPVQDGDVAVVRRRVTW